MKRGRRVIATISGGAAGVFFCHGHIDCVALKGLIQALVTRASPQSRGMGEPGVCRAPAQEGEAGGGTIEGRGRSGTASLEDEWSCPADCRKTLS